MSTSTGLRVISRRGAIPAVAIAALTLAGCGSNGGSGSSTAGSAGTSSGATITIRNDAGMKVLTTSSGRTLYFSSQEKGHVLCSSGACEAIWAPLTVAAGHKPSGPASLKLGTVKRPDGTVQVALQGKPLYTFSFDHGAGQVNGDGQHDSFDGTSFSWHAATPSGKTAAAPKSSPSSSPYGGGSYSY
jgi:predicted lipoprotein with Yx(FWY)xxD motif